MINISSYVTPRGKVPFDDWLDNLDKKTKMIIRSRLDRIVLGNFGDCTPIENGISELRIFYGPGYRVYFGQYRKNIVILLIGGDKGTQSKDISKAKKYWAEYRSLHD